MFIEERRARRKKREEEEEEPASRDTCISTFRSGRDRKVLSGLTWPNSGLSVVVWPKTGGDKSTRAGPRPAAQPFGLGLTEKSFRSGHDRNLYIFANISNRVLFLE